MTFNTCVEPCAIERGMRVIGDKWTGSNLWHLKDGPVRFNDLARMVGGASKKTIVERLRHFEAQILVRLQPTFRIFELAEQRFK